MTAAAWLLGAWIVAAARQDAPPWEGVSEANLKAGVERLVGFGTRHSLSKKGNAAAGDWLKAEFERIARDSKAAMTVEFHEFTDDRLKLEDRAVPQRNVVATLRGAKRPDEVVVFGAHYDSLNLKARPDWEAGAPGANDNASGTAAVLEAARRLSRIEHDRTIVFVCFAAEEQGLIGAWHFAKSLADAKRDVIAMLNNDIVGGARDGEGKPLNAATLRCYSSGGPESPSRRLARLAKAVIERRLRDIGVTVQDRVDRRGRGGDHQSFNMHGFTAIRFIEQVETDQRHHTPDDVIAQLDFGYFAKCVRADIALVENLAGATATPEKPEVRLDGGTVRVAWKAVGGARSYLVGVRTGPADFESVVEREGTEAAVAVAGGDPASVCVAAVDARGRISLFSPEAAVPR